ncbi:hypothetical protein D3C85_1820720 [compost metagenome]
MFTIPCVSMIGTRNKDTDLRGNSIDGAMDVVEIISWIKVSGNPSLSKISWS